MKILEAVFKEFCILHLHMQYVTVYAKLIPNLFNFFIILLGKEPQTSIMKKELTPIHLTPLN
jgi:hypothetical protein